MSVFGTEQQFQIGESVEPLLVSFFFGQATGGVLGAFEIFLG